MTTELIDIKQVELHFEKANGGGEMVERGASMAVTGALIAGTELISAKDIVPHGEWAHWLGKHWNYSQPKASRYMTIASNYSRVNNLKDAKSIREALRMIADEKAEKEPDTPIVPRSERKPADVKVSVPTDHPDDEPDPDPPPAPPTNRKTAKGSEKTPEDKKPKTPPIVPEIVDEPESDPWEYMTFGAIIEVAVSKLAETQHKEAAKRLRKAADKLDPPREDKIPTRVQLENAVPETWSKPLQIAAKDWAGYKQARKKDDRIQSLRAWQIALKQMADQPESIVIQKINNAIANSYKGWNHDSGNGKAQGHGYSNGRADGSCLGPNGRPEVQKRKIIYK